MLLDEEIVSVDKCCLEISVLNRTGLGVVGSDDCDL